MEKNKLHEYLKETIHDNKVQKQPPFNSKPRIYEKDFKRDLS